jgi:capsular polysaccharide biosynthesis protein
MVTLLKNPVQITVAENVLATPFKYDSTTTKITGCLYDANGERILSSQRVSGVGGDRIVNADPEILSYTGSYNEMAGSCIYLGHLMGHYGHFITETLSAFWAIPFLKFDRVAFHPFIFGGLIKPFMSPFLEAFDITPDKIVVLRDYTKFDRVYVPERLFKLNCSVHLRYAECGRQVANFIGVSQEERPDCKTYLSRSRLEGSYRTINNDKEVDELMESIGFSVIHPQELSVRDQISLYSRSRVMAGFSGSALHNCIFMNPKSILIEIGDPRSPDLPLLTQQLCNLSSGVRASHIRYRPKSGEEKTSIDLDYLKVSVQSLVM